MRSPQHLREPLVARLLAPPVSRLRVHGRQRVEHGTEHKVCRHEVADLGAVRADVAELAGDRPVERAARLAVPVLLRRALSWFHGCVSLVRWALSRPSASWALPG